MVAIVLGAIFAFTALFMTMMVVGLIGTLWPLLAVAAAIYYIHQWYQGRWQTGCNCATMEEVGDPCHLPEKSP